MTRRKFIQYGAATAASMAMLKIVPDLRSESEPKTKVPANRLPRWRGFNLLEKFDGKHGKPFLESDFALMAEWGFNFARLPMSYHCWTSDDNWHAMREAPLKDIDQAIKWGRDYAVHINLCLHRIPGYCVNPPKEIVSLWDDAGALDAAVFQWSSFAERYKSIDSSLLSFDLLNEPPDIPEAKYVTVITRLVEAIRGVDPHRLIIADGLKWGCSPVSGLVKLGIAQSTRGYAPMQVSHHRAPWVAVAGAPVAPTPTWPLRVDSNDIWDRARLKREFIDPWAALQRQGVGVHVGEFGAYRYTPHAVALAWLRDWMELWKNAGWGWALWNLRGTFGVLDSTREDIVYEKFKGHDLDRKMLELIREL